MRAPRDHSLQSSGCFSRKAFLEDLKSIYVSIIHLWDCGPNTSSLLPFQLWNRTFSLCEVLTVPRKKKLWINHLFMSSHPCLSHNLHVSFMRSFSFCSWGMIENVIGQYKCLHKLLFFFFRMHFQLRIASYKFVFDVFFFVFLFFTNCQKGMNCSYNLNEQQESYTSRSLSAYFW